MHRTAVFSLTLALTACAAQPPKPATPPVSSPKLTAAELSAGLDTPAAIENEKLRRLFMDLDRTESALNGRLSEFRASGRANVYQKLSFSSIQEIEAARQHARIFDAQMEGLGTLLEDSWAKIAERVKSSDLDEPLATQLRQQLHLDESNICPKYREWIQAARESVESFTRYLDFYQHHLGQFKLTETSLTFTDPKVAAGFSKAQTALVTADDHYRRAARAASDNRGNTVRFVLSTMRELEKDMTARKRL